MKRLCLLIILSITLFSCVEIRKDSNEKIIQLLTEWQCKNIVLPENVTFIDKDHKEYRISDCEYKVLVYIDSIDCLSCKLKLLEWESFVNYINLKSPYKLTAIFIFGFNQDQEIDNKMKEAEFSCFYCFDEEDEICKINKFPIEEGLDTYLLDVNDQVLLIGNPIKSSEIKDLYFDVLNLNQNDDLETEVECSENTIDLDRISTK